MGKIRPFVKDDISQVVDLHPRAFEDSPRPTNVFFEEVYFNNPWFDDSMPSLVYEQNNGMITGFFGVTPRRFLFKRQTIQAAIGSMLMVDPSSRSTRAGLQLVKTFLAGPQDLSMSDHVNFKAHRLWDLFKGQTVWIYSLQWSRAFRSYASRRVQSVLRKWKQPALSRYFCPIMDAFDERILGRHYRPEATQTSEEEIDENTIVARLPEFCFSKSLRPEYDEHSLKWLLKRAAARKQFGKLKKVGVHNGAGEIIGWYIYQLNLGGAARVLHIAAKRNSVNEVFDSLSYRTWQEQAKAVYGRLDPYLVIDLAARTCMSYHLTGFYAMFHSRNPELLSVIHRSDAFLTELDGERLMNPYNENVE